MNQQIDSSRVSAVTLRYMEMLEFDQNPVNVTRVIRSHVRSPINGSVQSTSSLSMTENSSYNNQLESSGFNLNEESDRSGDFIDNQPTLGQSNFFEQTNVGMAASEPDFEEHCEDIALSETSSPFNQSESFNLFKTPLPRKRRKYDFFDSSTSESMNGTAQPIGLATQYLFGNNSLSSSVYQMPMQNQRDNSFDFSGNNSIRSEVIPQFSLSNASEDQEQNAYTVVQEDSRSDIISHLSVELTSAERLPEELTEMSLSIDETLMPASCQVLEKTFMEKQKLNASTIYKSRYMPKTANHLIDNFYKVQKSQDWNAIAGEMIEMIEPKLDYLHRRDFGNKIVSLGDCEQEICEEEIYSCEDIRESLEAMEKSFENPDHSLVASTPNLSRSKSSKTESDKAENSQPATHQSLENRLTESFTESSLPKGQEFLVAEQSSRAHSEYLSFDFNLSNIFENVMEPRLSIPNVDQAPQELTTVDKSGQIDNDLVEVLQSQDPSQALQALSLQNPA